MMKAGGNPMAPSSLLRKHPLPDNLPFLFSAQRTLGLHSDLREAFPALAKLLQEELKASEIHLAFASAPEGDMDLVSSSGIPGARIRIGAYPCGIALGKEELVVTTLPGKRSCVEAPIRRGNRAIGALSVLFGSRPDESELALAADLVQWTCYLVEEASGLRNSLSSRYAEAGNNAGQQRLADRGDRPAINPNAEVSFHGIIGSSDAMKEVYTLIRQVADTEATVLITGESGTGKELVAKAIHERSERRTGPFVAVNCSALPEGIIESELFGHEKGAFTGAVASRMGRFEAARDGTLFLDEIGDLSQTVQVKLLRILQERSFERVGGSKSVKTNARILAATHRNLQEEVAAGRFREDLYFRLNVFPIHLPPLRERGADILLLADHFAEKFGASSGKPVKRISSPALDLLMIYHWPGNVRELENCIARAAIVCVDGVIHAYNLPPSLQSATSTGTEPTSTFDAAMARLEKELLVEALKIERGNSVAAARRLGVTERRFRLGLEKFKLDYRKFRTKM
jgi:Nif-specific regulatory protein